MIIHIKQEKFGQPEIILNFAMVKKVNIFTFEHERTYESLLYIMLLYKNCCSIFLSLEYYFFCLHIVFNVKKRRSEVIK